MEFWRASINLKTKYRQQTHACSWCFAFEPLLLIGSTMRWTGQKWRVTKQHNVILSERFGEIHCVGRVNTPGSTTPFNSIFSICNVDAVGFSLVPLTKRYANFTPLTSR